MGSEKMFEVALRSKIRFSYKGLISVEDLWDLSVESLDTIYKALNAQAKRLQEDSLLNIRSNEDELLTTQIDIVKHIVSVKLAESKAKLEAKEQKEKKEKILTILAAKQDAALENKSVEELTAMLNTL